MGRKETERRMETLREVRQQFNELEAAQKSAQSGSYTFLAQSFGADTMYGSMAKNLLFVVFGAVFGVMVAFIAFFKRRTHSIHLLRTCWVKLDYNRGKKHYQYPSAWLCIFRSVSCHALSIRWFRTASSCCLLQQL